MPPATLRWSGVGRCCCITGSYSSCSTARYACHFVNWPVKSLASIMKTMYCCCCCCAAIVCWPVDAPCSYCRALRSLCISLLCLVLLLVLLMFAADVCHARHCMACIRTHCFMVCRVCLQLMWLLASASSKVTSCKCRCTTQLWSTRTCCRKVGLLATLLVRQAPALYCFNQAVARIAWQA